MAKVLGFNHVSILVKNAEKSLKFYQEFLGLKKLKRPELGFDGYWLSLGARQSLHIMQLENPYQNITKPKHGGRDMHFALEVDSVSAFAKRLKAERIRFSESKSGRKAIFLWDLDENVIELFQKG